MRLRPSALTAALAATALTTATWAFASFFWAGVRGPTDANHRHFRADLMSGWLCFGSRDGPRWSTGDPMPIPRWRAYCWRNYNTLAYDENWGGIRSDLDYRVRIPLWAPTALAGASAAALLWRRRQPRHSALATT